MKTTWWLTVALLAWGSSAQAQRKEYRVERTGRNTYRVEVSDPMLDDPDRFLFNTGKSVAERERSARDRQAYDLNPDTICPPHRPSAVPPVRHCDAEGDAVYRTGELVKEKAEILRAVSSPSIPPKAAAAARANFDKAKAEADAANTSAEKCSADAKVDHENAVAKAAADAVELDRTCRDSVETLRADRLATAKTRPLNELAAIPAEYRLPEESARLKSSGKAKQRPRPDAVAKPPSVRQ